MSVVDAFIERLSGSGTLYTSVTGAADLAAIDKGYHGRPAAYVLTLEDASGPNERLGEQVLQPNEADIAVVTVLENKSDVVMAAAAGDIETYKIFVRGRLLGFTPDGASMPVSHVRGQLLKARNNEVWFEDVFAVSSLLISRPAAHVSEGTDP